MLEEFHRVAEGQRGHEVVYGVSGSSLGEVKVGLTMFTENNLKNEWVYSELAQLAI